MTHMPLSTALKLIRIAMGYGSRTERITRMLNSTDPVVSIIAHSLHAMGYLRPDTGTVYHEIPKNEVRPGHAP